MTKPFDFVDSASYTKEDLIEAGAREKDYLPFLTNKAFSYHSDSVLYANEMNRLHHLDRKLQYDYLRLVLRKRSRRSKWHKPEDQDLIDAITWRFGLSQRKAREAIKVLPEEIVMEIKKMRDNQT